MTATMSTTTRHRVAVVLAALALALTACSDATGPGGRTADFLQVPAVQLCHYLKQPGSRPSEDYWCGQEDADLQARGVFRPAITANVLHVQYAWELHQRPIVCVDRSRAYYSPTLGREALTTAEFQDADLWYWYAVYAGRTPQVVAQSVSCAP